MVCNGDVFVVGQQWILRTEQSPDIRGVVKRRVKIGIAPDVRGHEEVRFSHGNQQALSGNVRLLRAASGQYRENHATQRSGRPGLHQGVERSLPASLHARIARSLQPSLP